MSVARRPMAEEPDSRPSRRPRRQVETAIHPGRAGFIETVREVWRYRGLVGILVWRDIMVRYKQTIVGATWALLQPVLNMLIFTLVFGRLVRVPTDGVPYPLFALSALVPWTYFVQAVTGSTYAVVRSSDLVRKVYFPRIILPLAAVAASLVDFAVAFALLLVVASVFGAGFTAALWALPLFVLLMVASAFGAGLLLSALQVEYRDVALLLPFLMQALLLMTPVAYPMGIIPEPWRAVLALNPMAAVVEGFRWALFGGAPTPVGSLCLSVLVAMTLVAGGLRIFLRKEDSFADIV
jgi:lipopolysaccharide transport system permease protein